MNRPYLSRMTISTRSSNSEERTASGTDLHFRGGFRGDIRRNRKAFAERGVRYYQHFVYAKTGIWVPTYKIRIHFEREEPTSRTTKTARVVGQTMIFRNREVSAFPLGKGRMRIMKEKKRRYAKKEKRKKKSRKSK